MAGLKPELQFNSLQAGILPIHESNNPTSERYKSGMEECVGGLFKGGRLTHAPEFGEISAHTFPADFVPWPDNAFYKVNSTSTTERYSAKPADEFSQIEELSSRFSMFMAAKKFLSYPTSSVYGDPNTNDKLNGKYNFIPSSYTLSNCKILSTGESIKTSAKIRYIRVVTYDDGDGLKWGMVGRKSYKFRSQWADGGFGGDTGSDNGDEATDISTVCHGSGSKTEATGGRGGVLGVLADHLRLSVSVEPQIYEIPANSNVLVGASDVYLVGTIKMFDDSIPLKSPRDYEYSKSSKHGFVNNLTVSTDRNSERYQRISNPNPGLVYLLRWGTGDTAIPYAPNPDKTDDSQDAPIQTLRTANGFPWTSIAVSAASARFEFLRTRNVVTGLRRVGVAEVKDTSAGTGLPSGKCIGFTKLATASGDGNSTIIPTSTTDAKSPYIVVLDGPPLWIQPGYQGIFCGTATSEYIIQNEQSATNYSVRKISSIGASDQVGNLDYVDNSVILNGAVYFITARGVANLRFSNEAQAFIPSVVDLVDYGFGSPKSICSSKEYNCLFVSTDKDIIVTIYGDTGAISTSNIPEVSTPTTQYTFVGLRDDKALPYAIFVSGSSYYMNTLSSTVSLTNVKTTRFFFGIDKVCIIKRVHVIMSQSFGGKVRVSGNDQWSQIEYSSQEIGARSFTGTKSVPVYDLVGDRGIGKSVEIEFSAGEPMNIIGISVEGES